MLCRLWKECATITPSSLIPSVTIKDRILATKKFIQYFHSTIRFNVLMPLPIQCGALSMGNFRFHFLVQKLCALLRLPHPNFDCFILRTCNACLHMLCIIPSLTHADTDKTIYSYTQFYSIILNAFMRIILCAALHTNRMWSLLHC